MWLRTRRTMTLRIVLLASLALVASHALAADRIRIAVQKTGTLAWELEIVRAYGLDRKADLAIDSTELASTEAGKVALKGGSADLIVSDWLWVARERALGDDLKNLRRAVAGLPRAGDSVIVDLAAVEDDLLCEVVDRGELVVGGRLAIAHPLEVALFNAEFAEDCRVEGDAIVVVDCDPDGDTCDLARGCIELGRSDGATQTIEGAK